MIWDDLHFSFKDVMHHNADIYCLLSGREAGKSTAAVKFLLDKHMKTKKSRAIWLLRQKSQLNKAFYRTFLNDFEDYPFVLKHNAVYYKENDKEIDLDEDIPVITFHAVSTGNKDIKQTKYKDVEDVVYDEFLIDHTLPNERYLQKEAEILFKIWDTIQRRAGRKTKLWLLGNPYSMINPYFTWLRVEAKEVEKRLDKFYKPYGNRMLIYYFSVHPELLKAKENTTYGFFSKMNKDYYEHTFKSHTKYKPMFPVRPFKNYNTKRYMFKVKIEGTMLEFWNVGVALYIAENEYKKDKPIAIDFDSFEGSATYHNPAHPLYDTIRQVKRMISSRVDVVLESSNIENAVKLFVKQV